MKNQTKILGGINVQNRKTKISNLRLACSRQAPKQANPSTDSNYKSLLLNVKENRDAEGS